jgi:large subunit ribosomal protein L22
MEVKAIAKYVRVQPRKVRIIADEVRGKSAAHTVSLLRYHTSKSAKALHQVLVSAMANAQENHKLSPDQLKIAAITVDEGPRMKRMRARAMGRGNRILKKTSHITVVVEEYEAPKPVKPHGTKAKPRPTFSAPTKGKKKGHSEKAVTEKAAPAAVVAAPVEEPIVEVAAETPEAVVETHVKAHSKAPATEEATTTETAEEAPASESPSSEKPASDEKGVD